mmetsp:Transcript_8774/g.12813  ORF Transcript_8774/g.12813 Transcript_8774/m.12813 type:complete len:109 (+) Transcript_8774:120-446(+)
MQASEATNILLQRENTSAPEELSTVELFSASKGSNLLQSLEAIPRYFMGRAFVRRLLGVSSPEFASVLIPLIKFITQFARIHATVREFYSATFRGLLRCPSAETVQNL